MDFLQEMGIKDLEHVVLKARDYITIGPYSFEPGEPVLYFKNIQVALLSENTKVIAARGGFLNQPRVVWEDRSDVTFQFTNGTLNAVSLNMLLEANMLQQLTPYVPIQEIIELDEKGVGYLTHSPAQEKQRFYKRYERENVQPLKLHPNEEEQRLDFGEEYADLSILADYYYVPKNTPFIYTMSRERKNNLYSLEGTFYLKDENDGLLHSGIIEMPKVYIMSNINLRMGERADPTVGTFKIVAMPETSESYDSMVCRITYLDEDIYGI